ncbi:hypothetical protein ACGF0J_04680 [Nonomuraea sp. NPDC047897]|uniref:hypothetical protein n=1 Tax=Nonomuraea sp. NPDC047897 TaxID=3364346 RepID=UPI00371A1A80
MTDHLFKSQARVLDEDLSGSASTAGADALLAEIVVLERVPARRRLFAPRRALLGLAAAAVLAGAIVVGPSLLGTENERVYASQAVTIDRQDDQYVFYFTDDDPDPGELRKALRQVGLDNVTVTLFPVSPQEKNPVFGWEKTDPDARAEFTGSDCATRVSHCLTSFSVSADIEGPAEVRLGRPARPGEKYGHPAQASWPGEALGGIELKGRTAGEAERVVREHRLKVSYALDWPLPGDKNGFSVETDVPAARIDANWTVSSAETYNDGVIVLHVTPGPGATRPAGS